VNIITISYGPTNPTGLVFSRRLLSTGNGDAVAAFAAQDGINWVEVVSVEPVDMNAVYIDMDPVFVQGYIVPGAYVPD
jgi:hypothetical protein